MLASQLFTDTFFTWHLSRSVESEWKWIPLKRWGMYCIIMGAPAPCLQFNFHFFLFWEYSFQLLIIVICSFAKRWVLVGLLARFLRRCPRLLLPRFWIFLIQSSPQQTSVAAVQRGGGIRYHLHTTCASKNCGYNVLTSLCKWDIIPDSSVVGLIERTYMAYLGKWNKR